MKRISLLLSAAAIIGMGSVTVACSPRTEKPADTPGSSAPGSNTVTPAPEPTEKGMRTNVTRPPMSVSPNGAGGGNAAVPCGFGPAGGLPCSNNR